MKQETEVSSCGTEGTVFPFVGREEWRVMLHLPLLLSHQEGHLG